MTYRQDISTHTLPVFGYYIITTLMALSANLAHATQTEGAVRSPFRVVWNYPDGTCQMRNTDFELSKYGIVVNTPRDFVGNEVATLYAQKVGLWPRFTNNDLTKPINGGIPQLANLTSHLEKIRKDIAEQIREDSSGYGVLDQEIWRSLYEMNFGVYKIYKEIMERSLQEAQSVRPNVHWGYYLHPQTWWTTPQTQEINDRMAWLFQASTGIYPSIYIKDASVASPDHIEQRIKATLSEAIRVRAVHGRPSSPIVAYTMVQSGDTFFSQSILDYAIGQPAEMGIDGVIIWGSSNLFKPNPAAKCNAIKKYVQDTLGPYVSQLTNRLNDCSTAICGGRGRCIRKDYAQSVPHILVKEPLSQAPRSSSEAANSDGRVSLVKRAAFQESRGTFGRGYLDSFTGLSNWTRNLAWLRSAEDLSQAQHFSGKDILANINQNSDRDAPSLPQEQKWGTINATRARLFSFTQRFAVEHMNVSTSPNSESSIRAAIATMLHSSTRGNETLGLPNQAWPSEQTPSSSTVSLLNDHFTYMSDSATSALQTKAPLPDVTANFKETSPIISTEVTSTLGHTGLNNNYSFTEIPVSHTVESLLSTTPCSEDRYCTSNGTLEGPLGKLLIRSSINVNNVYTMGHTIFDMLTTFYNYYLGTVHQLNNTLVDQTSRTTPTQSPTDEVQVLDVSATVTTAKNPLNAYTVSPLEYSSTDINKLSRIQNSLLNQHVTDSQTPLPTEEYENYVCQCYDGWHGHNCEL